MVGFNPGLSVFAGCSLVGIFVFSWGFLADPVDGASSLLNVMPPLCVLVTVVCLVGTCRLVVDPDGVVEVVDPLVVRRVAVGELVRIEHHDGLHLRLVSARRIGSVAYGPSLVGHLLRYPRSARAAARIEAAVGGCRAMSQWPLPTDTATTQLRVRAYLGTLAVNAVLVLGTVASPLVQTAAQH